MPILCILGLHKFVWPEHDRPYIQWTYTLWCRRGCGNIAIRTCYRDEHDQGVHERV